MAQVLNAVRERTGFEPGEVDDVVAGCGAGSGDHAHDIARLSVLDAGWGYSAPGVTLHRFCGSGQQAVNFAAQGIASGQQDLVIAGGVESMSRYSPLHVDGFHANNRHLFEEYPLVHQGIAADLIATLDGSTRDDCDRYAITSQERAATALAEDRFSASITPIYHGDGSLALDHDEHPRPGTTLEDLRNLPPSFAALGGTTAAGNDRSFDDYCLGAYPQLSSIDHVHHAGNSSGVVDGASAIVMASSQWAKANGIRPRARVVATAVVGSEPIIMLTAPGPATQRCLARAGMTLDCIDLFEVNEAFAAVVLRFLADTGADAERVNVNGGAIAFGHPIGATGPMLVQTVLDELERRDLATGLVTMCTGGGMGTATIIERVR
jgi:acetyl-CoA C-acetyltransferase